MKGECKHSVCPANPQSARWVVMQRFRYKLGELPQEHVGELNRVGFVWDPTDRRWNEMFLRMAKYRGRHGDCNIPSA